MEACALDRKYNCSCVFTKIGKFQKNTREVIATAVFLKNNKIHA